VIIDDHNSERYHIVNKEYSVCNGWSIGWEVFDREGSPKVSLDVQEIPLKEQYNIAGRLNLNLWPDTKDYDQNSPGIIERAIDLDSRAYKSNLEKAFWLNVLRVPICATYLAACAKVRPSKILELGTGGDSAHSTGMFLYWLQGSPAPNPQLVSVDRHPLSHSWPRYRVLSHNWNFIQGDSITVMKALINGYLPDLPTRYHMIFIDSSHTYPHTLREIEQASYMTDAILLDDTTVPEVKQGLDEFLANNKYWLSVNLAHGVTLLERHERL